MTSLVRRWRRAELDRTVFRQLRQEALSDRFRSHRLASNGPRRARRAQRFAHSWSRWMLAQLAGRNRDRFAVMGRPDDKRRMRNARKQERRS